MLNMDEIHFVTAKKKSQFKIKTQIEPLIWNRMVAGEEVDKLLKEMHFILRFTYSYYLLGQEIDKYKNQLEWVENTLQKAEEQ